MPITLITGLPGHGKGVYSLDKVEQLRIATGRPVYYHNIKDLALQWIELKDGKDWINCPEGAIIVLDEAWQTFPIRPNAQTPPDFVAKLAVHRHSGQDIFIVTQQPTQIDTFVRKLVEHHYHIVRIFGSQKANVHQFVGLNPDPQKSRKNSIKHVYKYPKKVFEWYKSAEVHTIQTKRPMRIYMLWFGIPLMLSAAVYGAQKILNPKTGAVAEHAQENMKQLGGKVGTQSQDGFIKGGQQIKPELTYIQAHQPEILDFPHTAPIYKEVVKPVNAPYPAACIESKTQGCKCFTQQGTAMIVASSTCQQIVKTGFFIEWQQDNEPERQQITNQGVSGQSPDVDRRPTQLIDGGLRPSPNGA